jgi:protein subunit release factor B
MSVFPVSEAKEKALKKRLASLGINEEDIEESFIRSGGPGGQKVNKTATCVYLKHVPSGIEVKCSRTRTQGLNRYHARTILADKIDAAIKGRESEERKRIAKKAVSEKKRLRRPVEPEKE